MSVVGFAVRRPVVVTVGVLLIVMAGMIALTRTAVQLTPNIDRPIVTVTTVWPGRSPDEIVDRITKEQEERLKNVANLKTMRSASNEGQAQVTLEFVIGADMGRALQEVSDALRQTPDVPADAEAPVIIATEGSTDNAMAWFMIEMRPDKHADHPGFEVGSLQDQVEKRIKPELKRIDGVAEVNVFGGRKREARVLVDPVRLAQLGLTHIDVVNALRAENNNISAGAIAEGKRDFRVRVTGRFETPEQVRDVVIAFRDGSPVRISDVAEVQIGYEKRRGFVRSLGGESIAINLKREAGSNSLAVMRLVHDRIKSIQADLLPTLDPTVGKDLRIRQVYDETLYIDSSIALVMQNLWVGGSIAALVLLLFLRSFVATAVVALAIPISVIGSFLVMPALGRSINVISLAGLAFAVGMVVDNAIVVLENIDRRLRTHEPAPQAAERGGREVWGAVLASTLTTIAVFVPILTIQEEAGQLFRDIAIAISAAVALSLLVSIFVIPAACARWLHDHEHRLQGGWRTRFENLFGLAPAIAMLTIDFERFVHWCLTGWRAWTVRPAIVIGLTVASVVGAGLLMPPLDYLPPGNRNMVFGGLLIPPGYSVDQNIHIAERIEDRIGPYVHVDPSDRAAVAQLPRIPRSEEAHRGETFDPVPIDNFFIGSFRGGLFVGATSAWPEAVAPVGALITDAMNSIPDAFGGARQASIFGRGVGGGGTINLEISGPDLEPVTRAANAMFKIASQRYGYGNVRPEPANFNLAQPEWRLRLTRLGRELGLRTQDIGIVARAFFDGAFAGEYNLNGDSIDLIVLPKGGRLAYKEQLPSIPIATPSGPIVSLDALLEVTPATAPQQIQRIEELPSVSVRITPPEDRALEDVMREIRDVVVAPVRAQGLIAKSMLVRLEGTAAKLDEVRNALLGDPTVRQDTDVKVKAAIGGVGGIGALVAVGAALLALLRGVRTRRGDFVIGGVGALLIAVLIAGAALLVMTRPELLGARLVWAIVVTYLLMAALFESFLYPLVIMFTAPLALIGGFAALRIVHNWTNANPLVPPQQLDVLTMLGFIILLGVVVNNAILLVHQALQFMGGGVDGTDKPLPAREAIAAAVRTRIRPIFMSMLTSVGGMTPLVLFPGAGSELYRGLGSVVVGGLLVSTVFTLLLTPMLFSMVVEARDGLLAAIGHRHGTALQGAVGARQAMAKVLESQSRSTVAPSTNGAGGGSNPPREELPDAFVGSGAAR